MQHSSQFVNLVNDAKTRIKECTPEEVKAWQAAGETFYFVDTREESEFGAGALPEAIHISKGTIERDIEKKIPDHSAKIVLYCGGGSRSALVADNLQKMGYINVYSMACGYRGW